MLWLESKTMPAGSLREPLLTVKIGLPVYGDAYSRIVLEPMLATQRLPVASNAIPRGRFKLGAGALTVNVTAAVVVVAMPSPAFAEVAVIVTWAEPLAIVETTMA